MVDAEQTQGSSQLYRYTLLLRTQSLIQDNPLLDQIIGQQVSLDQLTQHFTSEFWVNFDPQIQRLAYSLLLSRIFSSWITASPFKSEYAEIFMNNMQQLQNIEPLYSPIHDGISVYGKTISVLSSSMSLTEVNVCCKLLFFLQQHGLFTEIQQGLESGCLTYQTILSDIQIGHTFNEVTSYLDQFLQMMQIGVINQQSNIQVYKSFLMANLMVFVIQCGQPSDRIRIIIQKMKALDCQSPVYQGLIANLEAEHGTAQEQQKKDQPSNFNKAPPGISHQTTMGNIKQRLQLQKRPLYTQIRRNPKVYVYKGVIKNDGDPIPIVTKEYVANSREALELFEEKEAKIIREMSGRHSCFLIYYGDYLQQTQQNEYCFGIVMQFCPSTWIEQITERSKINNYYTEQQLQLILSHLASGFQILHSQKFFHHDIKPHNIFIGQNKVYKIADFNVAQIHEEEKNMTTLGSTVIPIQGTDGYMAPEKQVIYDQYRYQSDSHINRFGQIQEDKADVYSLGLTFLQAYTLESVEGLNNIERQVELIEKIQAVRYEWLKKLLEKMLKYQPDERIFLKNIHSYLPNERATSIF